MSRFDLFFVIFDEKRDEEDFHIAHHIVNMHRLKDKSLHPDFQMEDLQTYIKFGRAIKPRFTKEAAFILKEEYKKMRQREKTNSRISSYKMTVRQLESLIRLSEGMARAHLDPEIKANYVREACRLMQSSNINIVKGDVEFDHAIQDGINEDLKNDINKGMQGMELDGARNEGMYEDTKKVKISYDEYLKLSMMITQLLSELKRASGEESFQQQEVVDKMV